jgi:hypothetical protein
MGMSVWSGIDLGFVAGDAGHERSRCGFLGLMMAGQALEGHANGPRWFGAWGHCTITLRLLGIVLEYLGVVHEHVMDAVSRSRRSIP